MSGERKRKNSSRKKRKLKNSEANLIAALIVIVIMALPLKCVNDVLFTRDNYAEQSASFSYSNDNSAAASLVKGVKPPIATETPKLPDRNIRYNSEIENEGIESIDSVPTGIGIVASDDPSKNIEESVDQPNLNETEESAPDVHSAQTDSESETVSPTVLWSGESYFYIIFIDVGQGDAMLIQCDGQSMLVDGGNASNSSRMYAILQKYGIGYLNYLIATHPDADHVGGLSGALNFAAAGKVYCSETSYNTNTFNDFLNQLSKRHLTINVPQPGETFMLGSASVSVLSPTVFGQVSENTSIALRIVYQNTSFLLMGDCEREDEEAILNSGYYVNSDLLKVSHHGSNDSTSYAFLYQVMPKYAVISVGADNLYGHPTEEVLSRLRDEGATVFRTDIQGDILCVSDGTNIGFSVERNADADTLASVKVSSEASAIQKGVPSVPPQTAEPVVETTAPVPVCSYIANTNTGVFHRPDCKSVKQMAEHNKWYFTGTRDELVQYGYRACKNCDP